MTHEKKRCNYCGHTYYYQGSGEGCLDKINNDRYCPKCMKIIIDSLDKLVPREDIIIKSEKEIDKETLSDDILSKMKDLKTKYLERTKNLSLSTSLGVGSNLDFDKIEIYHINGYKYYICWNDDNEEDKHYFQDYEYNPTKKEYIIPYENVSYFVSDSFSKGCNMLHELRNMTCRNIEVPFPKLSKTILDMSDWEWTIDNERLKTLD